MRIALVLLAFAAIVGCNNTGGSSDLDTGPAGGCGPMPQTGLPMCNTCVPCGPVMDSMGRRGCTDGSIRGCLDCPAGAWIMRTITGCFDDTGVHSDAGRPDAFMSLDVGASDGGSDAAASDGGTDASDGGSDASASDGGSDASASDANVDAH